MTTLSEKTEAKFNDLISSIQTILNSLASTGVTSSQARVTVSPNVGTTSVQIIGAKPDRKNFMLYNNSSNSCYVTFGATSTGSGCSFIVGAFVNWAPPLGVNYTGPLAAIRNAGTGTITITELI